MNDDNENADVELFSSPCFMAEAGSNHVCLDAGMSQREMAGVTEADAHNHRDTKTAPTDPEPATSK